LATVFTLLVIIAIGAAVVAWTLRARRTDVAAAPLAPKEPLALRFESRAARGTPEWSAGMRAVGNRMRASNVAAIVFVHGTFTGDDPVSAAAVVERVIPRARGLARSFRKTTRAAVERVLGDMGNFGTGYVRLFEESVGGEIACTSFTWSSENHHVGRLQGALDLVRVLATHAELGGARDGKKPRVLVMGHSHAGQLFALVTQLMANSVASEAVLDVARARKIDLASLDGDLDLLTGAGVDFVTFGAPARYAWAELERVRVLHVLTRSDLIRRLGAAGSDFPALDAEDRRANAALDAALGPGFAPTELVRALRTNATLPEGGEVALVDYNERLTDVVANGLGHGVYTRIEGMLFHAELVASRFYRDVEAEKKEQEKPKTSSRWRALLQNVR
jgi:hypothetical protein